MLFGGGVKLKRFLTPPKIQNYYPMILSAENLIYERFLKKLAWGQVGQV